MATTRTIVTIGLVQMRCTPRLQENLKKGLALVEKAARRGAQIVCLPELFRSLYFCQTEDHRQFALAEPIPGPTTAALSRAARKHRITIIGSIFEKRSAGVYHNTAVIIDVNGKITGKYRKMHIPDDPLYYEKFYFTPGDLGFQSVATKRAHIGTLICWDQWYPEAARLTALKGAQILFYPTAIGWHANEKKNFGQKQYDAWVTIQRSHAIANGVFVAVPNRTASRARCNSGAARSFVIRLVKSLRKPATTSRKSFSPSAIFARWRKRANTGRSCATAASMLTAASLSACSIDARKHSTRTRLSYARRVAVARRDVVELATTRRNQFPQPLRSGAPDIGRNDSRAGTARTREHQRAR